MSGWLEQILSYLLLGVFALAGLVLLGFLLYLGLKIVRLAWTP